MRIVYGVICLLLIAVAGTPAPAAADETTVSMEAEAWYQGPCAPASCPAGLPPANPYPGGTLHVGFSAGREESRTYLRFGSSGLPSGATLTGGILIAPVSPDAGTRSPETAKLRACLVTQAFEPSEGSLDPTPTVDCLTSVPAFYRPASPRAEFSVSLEPFAEKWSAGAINFGIALIPAEGVEPASWHVAFDGRTRPGGVPARAILTYTPASSIDDNFEAPYVSDSQGGDHLPASGVAVLAGPSENPPIPPAFESPAPVSGLTSQPAERFLYSAVLWLPLALIVLGGLMVRMLTQPISPGAARF